MDVLRNQNGERKQPSYIVARMVKGKIRDLECIKKAYTDWNGKLPIVLIDIDKCLESEKTKVEELLKKYQTTPTDELADRIYTKIRNNKVTSGHAFNYNETQTYGKYDKKNKKSD